jgi:hypothetical protein
MDMQKLLDAMRATSRVTRQNYHVTLGQLIAKLEIAFPNADVVFDDGTAPSRPHSYRGYYSDLAFERGFATTVAPFVDCLRKILNSTLKGYKGGDFLMDEGTPLWVSSYGCVDEVAIIAVDVQFDRVTLITKKVGGFDEG